MNYDQLIEEIIQKNKINQINNKIYLTNEQKTILNSYQIPYQKCQSMSEIIFCVEERLKELEDEEYEELESVSLTLSEFDYYHNQKK